MSCPGCAAHFEVRSNIDHAGYFSVGMLAAMHASPAFEGHPTLRLVLSPFFTE